MSSHFSEAARFNSNHLHLQQTHDEYPHVSTKMGVFQQHQYLNVNDIVSESQIPPTTALSARAFSGSNFIDYEIPRNLNILKSATLHMQIQNNDPVSDLEMPVAFNLINRIEYYFGSGLCETVLGEHLYMQYCTTHDFEQRGLLYGVNNVGFMNFDSDRSRVVEKNQSKSFYIRLHSLLSQTHLFLPGIKMEVRIRIHFNSYEKFGIQAYSEGGFDYTQPGTEPQMSKCDMILQHISVKPENYKKLMSLYKNNTMNLRYMDHRFQSVSLPLSQGVPINHVLSSLNGLLSHLYIFCRKQNSKGKQITQYIDLESFYITDSSGSSITNGVIYSDAYNRSIYARDHFENSNFFQYKEVYPLAFTQDVQKTIESAANFGSKYFSGQEQIYIKPGQSSTGAELMIFAYAHANLTVKNGIVECSKT